MIKVVEGEGAGFLTHLHLDLVTKRTIPIAEQQRNRITRNVGRDEVCDLVPIEVGRGDGGRILPDRVTGKIIEGVGRHVGIGLRTGREQHHTS